MGASQTAPGRATGWLDVLEPLLGPAEPCFWPSETDAERLRALAATGASFGGRNLKFDVRATQEADATRVLKALTAA